MTKARRIGPVLLMVLGAVLLFAPTPSSASSSQPEKCYYPDKAGAAEIQEPYKQCCGYLPSVQAAIVVPYYPCPTITLDPGATTEPPATEPPATEPEVTVTEPEVTVTMPAETTTTVKVASAGAVKSGTLARTGSNTAPMTAAGLSLLVFGAGLTFVGRRRRAQA